MTSLPTIYEYYTAGGITQGLNDSQPYFTLNEKNITLYSGALHYFRVPPEYWKDRMRKMKAAGLNTVETYVPWNLHEPQNGVYDFGNGGTDFQDLLNLEKFLKTAQEEDLLAIVRPGPYICAEWEFGGLPSWLLRENGIKVRTSEATYMNYVKRYFGLLIPIIAALQFTLGGPVIAVQIENEYGNANSDDLNHLYQLKSVLEENGIVELLFTSDTASYGKRGWIPEVLYTANFQNNSLKELQTLQSYIPGRPLMVMEYWSGWYDHWTDVHHEVSADYLANTLEVILSFPASVNFYMFHGGTSWGFLNGANNADFFTKNNSKFQPDISSYDYNCPLSESGDYTDKYHRIKDVIGNHTSVKTYVPPLPSSVETVAFEDIEITEQLSLDKLLENAEHVIQNPYPIAMEMLPINNNSGQSNGYIVYRKEGIDIPANSILMIEGHVCDTVMVLVNGKLMSKVLEEEEDLNGFGYWRMANSKLNLGSDANTGATLDLVVENWGRVNFGYLDQFNQFKGIWQGNVTLNNQIISDWKIIPLEFKKKWTNNLSGWNKSPDFSQGPALYKGIFKVDNKRDTFIDMRNWRKGVVFLNGFALSRHFRLGPQQSVYVPGSFLKSGDNEIVIFEHFVPGKKIKFSSNIIFETVTKIETASSSSLISAQNALMTFLLSIIVK